ncbi:Fc.00g002090.m01.CDS01 [Cosmosporella sp. VM-42]
MGRSSKKAASPNCANCANLTTRNWRAGGNLSVTVGALAKSSLNCSACGILLKGVSAHLKLKKSASLKIDLTLNERATTSMNGSKEGRPLFISHQLEDDSDEENCEVVELYVPRGNEFPLLLPSIHQFWVFVEPCTDDRRFADSNCCLKPWSVIGSARTLTTSFTLENAMLVSEWLKSCQRGHKACRQSKSELPTRVLFVGSDHREPHLYESRNEEAQYVALSHCWGDEQHRPLTTTKGTLPKRREAVSISDLPPTFKDAMELTRLLGIDYLWIDSLCIIQDDRDDWARESAKMADVYQQAALTVSADGALNSHEGLFRTVSQRSFGVDQEIHSPTLAEGSTILSRQTSLRGDQMAVHTITKSQANPLRSRAWTLQEWLLSSRVVHFTAGEMLWECNTLHRCECQIVHEDCLNAGYGESFWQDVAKSDYLSLDRGGEGEGEIKWNMILEEFANRHITKEADRLPALSGLAAFTKESSNVNYIAGLWESDLPEALLWRVDADKASRHEQYYAPSWSWPSIIGRACFDKCDPKRSSSDRIAKVLGVTKQLASANPFGSLKGGAIQIKGRLIKLPSHTEWNEQRITKLADVPERASYKGKIVLDVTDPAFEIASPNDLVVMILQAEPIGGLTGREGEGKDGESDDDEGIEDEYEDDTDTTSNDDNDGGNDDDEVWDGYGDRTDLYGLALKASGQDEHCFQRVGWVHLTYLHGCEWESWGMAVLGIREEIISII